jgi:hypothetical protein
LLYGSLMTALVNWDSHWVESRFLVRLSENIRHFNA